MSMNFYNDLSIAFSISDFTDWSGWGMPNSGFGQQE